MTLVISSECSNNNLRVSSIGASVTLTASSNVPSVSLRVQAGGATGPAGSPGGNTTEIVASENITLGQVINSDGTVANSAVVGKRDWIVGVSNESVLNGFPCTVVLIGEATNLSWAWNEGDVVYLNGNTLSTTAPSSGFIKRIGTAKSGTVLEVNIGVSILI